MVLTNVVNECMQCKGELVTRKEIETLVTGAGSVTLHREHMRHDIYMSGAAFVYAEFSGVTGSLGETENVVCECNASVGITPSLTMIREEHRAFFAEKFGTEFSVPFIFSVPVSMVAWENCALVGYEPSDDGLKLVGDGVKLVEMIADMSRLGLFSGGAAIYTGSELISGFTYLHTIKPAYRSFAAIQYGASVTVEDFFSTVTLDWLDWQMLMALKCEVVDGVMQVSRVRGVSLYAEMTVNFSRALRARSGDPPGRARSIVEGSFVTVDDVCVQFMPPGEEADSDDEDALPTETAVVALGVGQAFIPSGIVVLHGDKLAVTFEPGVTVVEDMTRDSGGTHISGGNGAVCLFLDGSVRLILTSPALVGGGGDRHFQVHVQCESYGDTTLLGKWYCERLDPTSTSARFFAMTADVVVLHSPDICSDTDAVVDVAGAVREKTVSGVGYSRLVRDGFVNDSVVIPVGREHTLHDLECGGSPVKIMLNGVVQVSSSSRVGFLRTVVVRFVVDCFRSGLVGCRPIGVRFFRARVAVVNDAFGVDYGGSDLMGDDELSTWVHGKQVQVVCAAAQRPGFPTYCKVASNAGNMAWELGTSPTLEQLLRVPAKFVDFRKLEETGFERITPMHWELGGTGGETLKWRELAEVGDSWMSVRFDSFSLIHKLRERYGFERNLPVRVDRVI